MCHFQFCDADMMLTMPTLTYLSSSLEIQLKHSEAALSPLIWWMEPTSFVTGHISSLRTRKICKTLLIWIAWADTSVPPFVETDFHPTWHLSGWSVYLMWCRVDTMTDRVSRFETSQVTRFTALMGCRSVEPCQLFMSVQAKGLISVDQIWIMILL